MCEGIVSRPFYAKVESGKNRINAESLFEILFKHQVDVLEFSELIQETYISGKNKTEIQFKDRMDNAVNTRNVESLERYCQKIVATSDNKILKLRALVTLAYFKGEVKDIDENIYKELKKEFDEGRNWTTRPDLLTLLGNTMPLWSQEELDFLISRLLASVKRHKYSELALERYLRIFGNYLVTCYDRKISIRSNTNIVEVINYIISTTKSFHLMIYRINTFYLEAMLSGNIDKAQKIRKNMEDYGYGAVIASWPIWYVTNMIQEESCFN